MFAPSTPHFTDYSRLEKTVFRQARARELKALVVGAGALGNEVVKALGLLGVGRITVVDPDRVEASNLTRSLLWRSLEAVGRNKALALVEAAGPFFPDTALLGIGREIADVGFQEIASADIIFTCVDSDLARLELAYIATKLDRPAVDGGLGTQNYSQGRVTQFGGRSAACFSCRLTQQKRRELLTFWESAVRSCWAPMETEQEEQSYPSTPTMAAVVGAMQVELGLRRLFAAQPEGCRETTSVEICLDPVPKLEAFTVPRSETCPFHGTDGALVVAPGPVSATTVEELLDSVGGGKDRGAALVLDWPLCSSARCVACGFSWPAMQRLAALRRRGSCPSCGSRLVAEEDIIRSVERDSRWASLTLADLALPEHHLYTIRLNSGAQ